MRPSHALPLFAIIAGLGASSCATSTTTGTGTAGGIDPVTGEPIASGEARAAFGDASNRFKSKDYAGARAGYEGAAKADPQFALARYNAAVLYEREGKLDDAKRLYREATGEKDVAGARLLLTKVIDKDPEHVDARAALANMALSNRDWKTASQQLEALSKLDSKNPSIWNNLGLAYKGYGRFDDARKAYTTALQVKPDFAEASLNLGLLELRHLLNPDAALVAITRYREQSSSPVEASSELLVEANALIEGRAEEKRMLAEQAQLEEEMKQKAEADAKAAKAAAAAAPAGAVPAGTTAEAPPGPTTATDPAPAVTEPEAEEEVKAKEPVKKKTPAKKPPPKKTPAKKPSGPATDDNFYND